MGNENGFEWKDFSDSKQDVGDFVVANFLELIRLIGQAEMLRRRNSQPGEYDVLSRDPEIKPFLHCEPEAIPEPQRTELATAALYDRLSQDKQKETSWAYEGLRRKLQDTLKPHGVLFARLVHVEAVVSGERPIEVRKDTEHKDHTREVIAIISGGAKPSMWPRLHLDSYQLTPSGPVAKRNWRGTIHYVVDVINPRTLEPRVTIEEVGPQY